ncbi:MAG TPA: hypothetical protein VFX61_03610 [Micromonosporaceae bacterium]|nr:hypothetical protein [Micromonosporaceae bacterium]
MQQVELSSLESLVFVTVTAMEARGQAPYLSEIAHEAELPLDEVSQTLHSLAEKNLLHREDTPVEGTDFGPRWCVRQPA